MAGRGDQDPPPSPVGCTGTAGTESRRGLRLLQWNCDWLGTKFEELRELMQEDKVDVAIVQETKMLPSDREPHLDGYKLARRDRRGAVRERGGDLAFVVRRGIGFLRTRLGDLQAMEADVLNINGQAGRILNSTSKSAAS